MPSPILAAYEINIFEKPGAIPTSQRTFAPDFIADLCNTSGVFSLKLKSTIFFPFETNNFVTL